MQKKAPNDQDKEYKTEQLDHCVDEGLNSFWQEDHKELHLHVSAQDESHGGCEGHGDQLCQHHDIQGTEYGETEKLGAYNIYAGQDDHEKKGAKAYPFYPATYLPVESLEFFQHNYFSVSRIEV